MGKVKEMGMYKGRRMLHVTDCEGHILNEGDVVAEGKVGDLIWDGQAKIVKPVLAIVVAKPGDGDYCDIDDINLVQLESGEAILTSDAAQSLWNQAGDNGEVILYLNTYDGQYNFEIQDNKIKGIYFEGVMD